NNGLLLLCCRLKKRHFQCRFFCAVALGCEGAGFYLVPAASIECGGAGSCPVPALRGVSVAVGGSRSFGPACPHPPGLRPLFCGAWLDRKRPPQTHPTSQELRWGG